MLGKIKEHQRSLLVALIILCVGTMIAGGIRYFGTLRKNLEINAVQNVMNLTLQHRQAFDSFISADQQRLHRYADYFAENGNNDAESIQRQLTMFYEPDSIYSVTCLDEGWFCSSAASEVRQVPEEGLERYRSLEGSGVRDSFVGLFSGLPKFSYYETFTFNNGHKALIQKTYERNKVSETFSLSIYDGHGNGYLLDRNGDILMRSTDGVDRPHDNIFQALTDAHDPPEDVEELREAMEEGETGCFVLYGDNGGHVFAFTPVESVNNWYLLSVVPIDEIRAEGSRILEDTKVTLWIFGIALFSCAVFVILMWRTHKEMEAKDQEVKYRTQLFDVFTAYLSSHTDDMFMILDQDTERLEYVSPNVERVLGVEEEDLMEYMRASDMAADRAATLKYYEDLNSMSPGDSLEPRNAERVNPKTGEHKYFLENSYCVDVEGRVKRVCYISDRTREHKAQNDLSQALHMAQAANQAKSAFLSSVSHDIRTPMNAIIGFLALMRNEAENPAIVREYTQRIDAASQHLLGLINDVLDMNKIESGSTTLSVSEMNLAEVIEEINTMIRPQAKAKGQTFDIFVTQLAYEHLYGDKMRINQILINLLSNAVKYTPNGGKIEMRVQELPQVVNNYSRVRFTVSDNGIGMSESYLRKIFDPFTREETKTTHEIQGTGLGMAITKSLVELMGGSIRVESTPGEGSAFTVELELRIQERETQQEDPEFWDDHSVTKMIVVDDDREVCENIVRTMARTGVVTEYATSGEGAMRKMRAARESGRPYDLILLDWMMPGLNGLETARRIRREYPDKIPILLLTAYDWSEIEQEAMDIGVNHFMPKPFFISSFKDAIRRVMGSTKAEEAQKDTDVVRSKHIMVVDDIEVNRIILTKILSSLGADCDTASNGKEAVDKFLNSEPGEYDLILMDVQMPVMDGYAAARAIRASAHPLARSMPVIAMTANAFVDDVREAIEAGMDAHIAKPVQIDNLKATIKQVFEKKAGK